MKKIITLSLLLVVIGMQSCSNDFELIDDWKDIPIVYGLLSPIDTAQYIRIEKAFVDPSTSALTIAQNPDSLYYDNISVQLKRESDGQVYTLNKVDGNAEGYQRESGVFADSPNYLYKIKTDNINLVGGEEYTLMINRGDNLDVVTASEVLVKDLELKRPTAGDPIQFVNSNTGEYNSEFKVRWLTDRTAHIFDVRLLIHYWINEPNIPTNLRTLSWIIDSNRKAETDASSDAFQLTTEIEPIAFYRFLQNNIDASENVNRYFRSIDVIVDAGGQELLNYIDVGQANTGITSSQVIPTYTNLSEGQGVFSAKNQVIGEFYTISGASRDSLRESIFTRKLNFQ